MNKQRAEGFVGGMATMALILLVFMLFVFDAISQQSYKAGQVDAIKGNVQYYLEVKPDSIWHEIEDK